MKSLKRALMVVGLLLSIMTTSVYPVFAEEVNKEQTEKEESKKEDKEDEKEDDKEDEKKDKEFRGWNSDISRRDAYDVYAMTNWTRYSKELLFKRGTAKIKAVGLSREVEDLRPAVKEIISEMDETYGIFPNEDYTELMLALIQELNGPTGTISNKDDPANVVTYIDPKLKLGINQVKSIKKLFERVSAAESLHHEGVNLYKNDAKLQSVMQSVVFSPNYTYHNKEYTVESAEKHLEDYTYGIYGNPSPRFAQRVAEHYSTTSVIGGGPGGSLIVGNGEFAHPCPNSTLTSPFGYRDFDNSHHDGIDLAAPEGTPTYAAADGTVLYATSDGGYNGGAGNWVVIDHGNGLTTTYMHHSQVYVSPGETVTKGQNIGAVGNTGLSTGPHLHFQVEVNGEPVNPELYL